MHSRYASQMRVGDERFAPQKRVIFSEFAPHMRSIFPPVALEAANSDLVVHAPPLYIQEKVHPKVLIDGLLRQTEKSKRESEGGRKPVQLDLFSDFNGVPEGDAKTEFYQHDQNWSNRMILGDSRP